MQSILENRIEQLITPSVNAIGYDIVRVKLMEGKKRRVLQIMAETTSDGRFSLDDCTKVSHTVSAILDVEDPIAGEYELEVSSPGIDRPLVKRADFDKFADNEVKIVTRTPIEGRRKFRGLLLGGDTGSDAQVTLKFTDTGDEIHIPYDNIDSAKLVITDKLLAVAANDSG